MNQFISKWRMKWMQHNRKSVINSLHHDFNQVSYDLNVMDNIFETPLSITRLSSTNFKENYNLYEGRIYCRAVELYCNRFI